MIKVLLIAPRTNLLGVDIEVQNVLRSGLSITPLFGDVKRQDLIREFASQYDILWIATHMNEDGIIQLGTETITTSDLIPLIGDNFNLVYLNSCQSRQTAQQIQNITGCGVICTVTDIPDIIAYQTGSLFAKRLCESGSIEQAYKSSIPGGNLIYLYLGNLKNGFKMPLSNSSEQSDINKLTQAIYKLDATLTAELKSVKERVEAIEEYNREMFRLEAERQNAINIQRQNQPPPVPSARAEIVMYLRVLIFMIAIFGIYLMIRHGI